MNPPPTSLNSDKKYLWLLFLVLLPLYLTWTFDHSLWNPDETRDAGIAREMFVSKDFVTPHLNGEPFLEKPPLYYWTCSAVYALTGRITAGLTRLPAALYGFLGLFFTFLIGRRCFNARTGFMAAAILATSFQYFNQSHYAMMDSSLAALLTGALYFYLSGSTLGFVLLTILAFYTKGFVAVALAGVIIGTDLILRKDFSRLIKLTLIGTILFTLCVSPWVFKLWKAGGENFMHIFFIDNNWNRFFSHTITDHRQPFYFYLGSFVVDFLPWTFIFIAAVVSAIQLKREPAEPIVRFLKVWFLSIFIFLSISSSKRSMYLLPAFPAAALFCAHWLSQRPNGEKLFRRFFIGSIILILAGNIFFIKTLDRDKSFLPFIERVKQERQGAKLVAYDLSEMERGVFPFYFEEKITNFTRTEDLTCFLLENKTHRVLLIANRNKFNELTPPLKDDMDLIFTFRPEKKNRSYLLYVSHPTKT